jgi:hypothetical protein
MTRKIISIGGEISKSLASLPEPTNPGVSAIEQAKAAIQRNSLEREFSLLLLGLPNIPPPTREYQFSPPRRWRFDFAWPEPKFAVEIHGGTYLNGGHNRPLQFKKDCEKHNAAVLLGWKLLLFTRDHIKSGEAQSVLAQLFGNPDSTSGR